MHAMWSRAYSFTISAHKLLYGGRTSLPTKLRKPWYAPKQTRASSLAELWPFSQLVCRWRLIRPSPVAALAPFRVIQGLHVLCSPRGGETCVLGNRGTVECERSWTRPTRAGYLVGLLSFLRFPPLPYVPVRLVPRRWNRRWLTPTW